jgi:mono/diheme cytochrome c family protein
MRRAGLLALLVLLLGVVAVAAAGCGGEEEASPTAETVEGGEGNGETETEEGTTTAEGEETETAGGGTEGDAQAGEAVFNEAGCGGCHVLEAAGSSGQVGPNLDDSQPDFDLVVERVTNGQGAMPSFKDQLSEEEIRNVAAYVVESTSG